MTSTPSTILAELRDLHSELLAERIPACELPDAGYDWRNEDLAALAKEAGHPSLREALNNLNAWDRPVGDIASDFIASAAMLRAEHEGLGTWEDLAAFFEEAET